MVPTTPAWLVDDDGTGDAGLAGCDLTGRIVLRRRTLQACAHFANPDQPEAPLCLTMSLVNQAYVVSRHTWLDAQIWFTDTQISSVPYKTPWKNHREGMILPVFVCSACLCLS